MSIEFCPKIYKQYLSDLSCRVQNLNSTLTNIVWGHLRMKWHYEKYQETNNDTYVFGQFINEYVSRLVDNQMDVYHCILNNSENDKRVTFFIDALGGTGKTFLINLLIAKVHQKKNIALAVASSRIAATLLGGERTAHSMSFFLHLDLTR